MSGPCDSSFVICLLYSYNHEASVHLWRALINKPVSYSRYVPVQVSHEIGNQILWNSMLWSKMFAQKRVNIVFTNMGNVLENFLIFRQVRNLQSIW